MLTPSTPLTSPEHPPKWWICCLRLSGIMSRCIRTQNAPPRHKGIPLKCSMPRGRGYMTIDLIGSIYDNNYRRFLRSFPHFLYLFCWSSNSRLHKSTNPYSHCIQPHVLSFIKATTKFWDLVASSLEWFKRWSMKKNKSPCLQVPKDDTSTYKAPKCGKTAHAMHKS